METVNFEKYAEARIPQLRSQAAALTAEAEALAKALAAFRNAGSHQSSVLSVGSQPKAVMVTEAGSRGGRQMQPGSQSHNILALLDEAAGEGRSLPDLYSALAERGVTNNKASVRSVVWTLKNAKKIVPHGDRYYAAAHAPHA